MQPTLTVDTKAFNMAVDRYVRELGASKQKVLRNQAKLLVQQAIQITPPFASKTGENGRVTPNLKAPSTEAKAAGEAAIRGDMERAVDSITESSFIGLKPALKERLDALLNASAFKEVEEILSRFRNYKGFRFVAFNPQLHRGVQNRRGRIPRDQKRRTFDATRRDSYLKARLAMVGYAKGGWAVAARALGVAGRFLPGWITRHNSPGGFFEVSTGSGSVTITNSANASPELPEKIEQAMAMRARSMTRDIKRILDGMAAGKSPAELTRADIF
jgi:hypothetical protein